MSITAVGRLTVVVINLAGAISRVHRMENSWVTYHNKVAQLQMASKRSCFASNTLHETAVTSKYCNNGSGLCVHPNGFGQQTIRIVVDEVEAILVEGGTKMSLSDGKTDCAGDALSERAGRELDTICVAGLWMAWCQGIDLTECLEIV